MKSRVLFTIGSIMICTMILLVSCAQAPVVQETAPAKEATPTEEATPTVPEGVTLTVYVPGYMSNDLTPIVEAAAERLDVRVEILGDPDFGCFYCFCGVVLPPNLLAQFAAGSPPDLFLFSSASVPLSPFELESVPDEMHPPVPSAIEAFRDPETGRVIGLAQGSAPMMMIYNPNIFDELGIEYPDKVSWDEMAVIAKSLGDEGYRVAIAPDSSIALTAIQSAYESKYNEEFSVLGFLTSDFIELANESSSVIMPFFEQENVYSPSYSDMLQDFQDGEIAITMISSIFLADLTADEYDGSVGVTYLPSYGEQGSSTHMAGWMVPADSNNSDLAWELAHILSNDPAMVEFGLKRGLLPVTTQTSDGQNAMEIAAEIYNLDSLENLQDIAWESKAWQFPVEVEGVISNIIELGDQSTADLANSNGEIELTNVAENLASILVGIDLP